ncbi:MAG: hypothetical protein NW201_12730 [Gemmatimonadales bacterium]|nr:hypothetical protein [Gemmatimonadales bacterium]
MIELDGDTMVVSFPDVHPAARLRITFQRTLRIPDDGSDYPLPPGLGAFPLRHVDDFAASAPPHWLRRGGVMLPMYQSEAMWLHFTSDEIEGHDARYPFAIRVAAGKVDAVTGEPWRDGLSATTQNYVVSPRQPWLDGFCVKKGTIRQFVAMPLGDGYSVEKQVTGREEHGGLQLQVVPMRRAAFERRFPKVERHRFAANASMVPNACADMFDGVVFCKAEMSLGAGGRMRQEISADPFDFADWATEPTSRCFVHLVNSLAWRKITGEAPPTVPFTAAEYNREELPWFEYYADGPALDAGLPLKGIKSILELAKAMGTNPLPENQPVTPANIVQLRQGLRPGQVREGSF